MNRTWQRKKQVLEKKNMVPKHCAFEELRAFWYDWSRKVYVGGEVDLCTNWGQIVRFLGYFRML